MADSCDNAKPCVSGADDVARNKLAYLFTPTPLRCRELEVKRAEHLESEHEEPAPEEQSPQVSSGQSCDDCCAVDSDASLREARAEIARLKAQVEDLQQAANQTPHPVLGIRSSRCAECKSESAMEGRVFAELSKLYCERCWAQWERCGRWHPTMRVCTVAPAVGSSGLPEFDAEDAFVLPSYICDYDDLSLMERLRNEVPQGRQFSDWHGARHLALHFDGAEVTELRSDTARPVLRDTIKQMEAAFGIKATAVRLNLYRSNADYKPFHADRGRDDNGLPQCTVGLSLGATRELSFTHYKTGVTMTFPQRNGDVFAFTPELNKVFLHGVPRVKNSLIMDEPRISLILWGSRLALLHPSTHCER